MQESPTKIEPKWHHPTEVMKLHQLKIKKKALQARIKSNVSHNTTNTTDKTKAFEDIITARKRKNPFIINKENNKRNKDASSSQETEESSDATLFKLLHQNSPNNQTNNSLLTFSNILNKLNTYEPEQILKSSGESWLPIDWALKTKIRLWSSVPFQWNQKLKISEEASGITSFARCLDNNNATTLDTAPNSKFHHCCLYWQQPSLPWLKLFPRTTGKVSEASSSIATNPTIRASLQSAWSDSLRSLFHLIRTKQCPYFYAVANNFTVLFRAAGICGFSDVHALVAPTTRGFRNLLRQEDIEFTMPLKKKRNSDSGCETLDSEQELGDGQLDSNLDDEEASDEQWLKQLGINADDIKQINYTQAKIVHKSECQVDNSEESLVLVEGVEVHAFYNFLMNCKSAAPSTGPFAGIPPTLLAPVAFNGATLNALKVQESKVNVSNTNYYSLELSGPILPNTIHNLFSINPTENSISATFVNISSTKPFSKVKRDDTNCEVQRNVIFDKANLSDCGLASHMIEQFCSPDLRRVTNVECLKYSSENKTYSWT